MKPWWKIVATSIAKTTDLFTTKIKSYGKLKSEYGRRNTTAESVATSASETNQNEKHHCIISFYLSPSLSLSICLSIYLLYKYLSIYLFINSIKKPIFSTTIEQYNTELYGTVLAPYGTVPYLGLVGWLQRPTGSKEDEPRERNLRGGGVYGEVLYGRFYSESQVVYSRSFDDYYCTVWLVGWLVTTS